MSILKRWQQWLNPFRNFSRIEQAEAALEQNQRTVAAQYEAEISDNKQLGAGLQSLYSLLLQRINCHFRLNLASGRSLKLNTRHTPMGIDIVVCVSYQNENMATVRARTVVEELGITDMHFNTTACDQFFRDLIGQTLIMQAEALELPRISGRLTGLNAADFKHAAQFYRDCGFQVDIDSEKQTGIIYYDLKKEQLLRPGIAHIFGACF